MITVGSRIRWRGLLGHEGTVVQLSDPDRPWCRWAWIEYDDGTEKDAYLTELKEITGDENRLD